jgi:hypothetical protein
VEMHYCSSAKAAAEANRNGGARIERVRGPATFDGGYGG